MNILRYRTSQNPIPFSTQGITLTELLVATILIGFVMLGVASFSVAVSQMHGGTSKAAILAMKAQTAMTRLTDDAYAAVGDQTDRGIVTDASGSTRSICFRHDTNDPSSYADDTWTCYYKHSDDVLWRCNEPAVSVPPSDLTECDNGGTSDRLLELTQDAFFSEVEDASNRLEYIEFTFVTRDNIASAVHPVNNPDYTLITRVSPPGHGR